MSLQLAVAVTRFFFSSNQALSRLHRADQADRCVVVELLLWQCRSDRMTGLRHVCIVWPVKLLEDALEEQLHASCTV